MNQVIKTLLSRQSVKKYKSDMVPEDLIAEICKAGTFAPTGMNRQSPIIIAVTNRVLRDRLSKMNADILGISGDPFYGAPVVLVVLARKDSATRVYDGSLVMANLQIAAHSLGLGSRWIHRAKEEMESPEGQALLAKWGITGEYAGIGHCILGYADGPVPQAKPRKADYIVRV